MIIIILIIGACIGFVIAYILKKEDNPVLIQKQKTEKKDNLEKIIKFVKEKGKISNNDVERICKVSNTSAWRYLEELEKQGEIKQVGNTGKHTYYKKI